MPNPRRSLPITLLAIAMVLFGALLTPISFITVLMLIAGSPGTQSAEFLEGSVIVFGPLFTVVSGVGLWFRKRWAWWCTVAILVIALVVDVRTLVRGPQPERVSVSASGVRTTTSATGTGYALPSALMCSALLALLAFRRQRGEFSPPSP